MGRATSAGTLWVQPTGAAVGADVHGIDLSVTQEYAVVDRIRAAWMEHLVLRFPGQRLTDAELAEFGRHFGDLDERPEYAPQDDEPPEARWITRISNILVDGKPIGGLGYGEAAWHADMTYNCAPPRASLLYALECPPEGGDTWFANMYAAWDELDGPTKARIGGLSCVHDASHDSSGRLRPGFSEAMDPRETPGARHPLVRVHPATQRPCLFLGRRAGAYIVGLPLEESEALLEELWAHATQERFVWKQRWRVGDVLLWDNRCVLHRRDAFDNATRRLMHRTQISGEPVEALSSQHLREAV